MVPNDPADGSIRRTSALTTPIVHGARRDRKVLGCGLGCHPRGAGLWVAHADNSKSKCVQMDGDEFRLSAYKIQIFQRVKAARHHSRDPSLRQNKVLQGLRVGTKGFNQMRLMHIPARGPWKPLTQQKRPFCIWHTSSNHHRSGMVTKCVGRRNTSPLRLGNVARG